MSRHILRCLCGHGNKGLTRGLEEVYPAGGVLSVTFNNIPYKDSCHLCHHSGQINKVKKRSFLPAAREKNTAVIHHDCDIGECKQRFSSALIYEAPNLHL